MPAVPERRHTRRQTVALIGALVCTVLLGSGISPVAAATTDPAGSMVGGFGIGDRLEATIDPRDGAGMFSIPAGPLSLHWDSRLVPAGDPTGFGRGWSVGVSSIATDGGVRVVLPNGRVVEADASSPTGLVGYETADIWFEQRPDGTLEGRPDGAVGERVSAFVLHALGGQRTHYDAEGRAIAQIDAHGSRTDWVWAPTGQSRLTRMVDPDGVVTELDWPETVGEVRVRVGANLPADPEGVVEGSSREWRIVFDADGIREVVDPLGGRTALGYVDGLIARLDAVSGARTEVEWRAFDDAVPRVGRVRTTDEAGRELSARVWSPVGAPTASGWPAGKPAEYTTQLGDGVTTVHSRYDDQHELEQRDLLVSTVSGTRLARSERFGYSSAPELRDRPTSAELTVYDERGGSRTTTQRFEFDGFGRGVREISADGTVTTTEYDSTPATGSNPKVPPVGLTTSRTVTAPDGLVTATVSTLNDARTAVVAAEEHHGRVGEPLTAGARTEYTIDADGAVTEERAHPADRTDLSPAAVTRVERRVDLERGTRTTTRTSAAGTSAEGTTSETISLVHGEVVAATTAAGATTGAKYDALGRVVVAIDAAGNQTRTEHANLQLHGRNVKITTGATGVAETEELDEIGRLVRRTDNLRDGAPEPGHVRVAEVRAYPSASTVRVTDAWGATTETVQDVFAREVRSVAANGLVRVTEHDDVANTVTTGLTPTGQLADAEYVTTEHRDLQGRPTASSGVRADGRPALAKSSVYDGLGRLVAQSDGRTEETVRFDALGRPVSTTVEPSPPREPVAPGASHTPGVGEPAAHAPIATRPTVAERRFEGFGESVQKTLSDGVDLVAGAERKVDASGQVVEQTDRAGRTTRYAYTPDGLVERMESTTGEVTETSYDPATRQATRVSVSSPGLETITSETEYDEITALPIAVFDPADRAGTQITYEHDAFGNVTRLTYPDGGVIEHDYDEHGRLESTTDVAGITTQLSYDRTGLLVSAVQHSAATDDAPSRAIAEVRYHHDAYGRVERLDRGNGVHTEFTFTSTGDIASETTASDERTHSERAYEYDVHGNLISRVDRVSDDTGAETTTTTTYTYDAFNRLRGSRVHDGATAEAPVTREHEYEVGLAGSVTAETVTEAPRAPGATGAPGAQTTVREFEYSASGELVAIITDGDRVEQAYDEAGRLTTADDGAEFTYDAAGRPVSHTAGGMTIDLGYWADGSRRSLTTTDPATGRTAATTYYWDDETLLSERHDAGDESGTASYLMAATRHSRTIQSAGEASVSYYGTDRQGNVTELTDASGATTQRYSYTDYGVTTSTGQLQHGVHRNPFTYASEHQDPDGTFRLGGVRSYDPAVMSFTTPDPADLFTDYAYADLNPIGKADPSGRAAIDLAHVMGWAGFGLAVFTVGIVAVTAIATAGWSLSMLSLVNLAVQGTTIGMGAAQIADQINPSTLTDQQSLRLSYGEIGVGFAGAFFGIPQGIFGMLAGARARDFLGRIAGAVAIEAAKAKKPLAPFSTFQQRWTELLESRRETITRLTKGIDYAGQYRPGLPREVAELIVDPDFRAQARRLYDDIVDWRNMSNDRLTQLDYIRNSARNFSLDMDHESAMTTPFRASGGKRWADRAHESLVPTDEQARPGGAADLLLRRIGRWIAPTPAPPSRREQLLGPAQLLTGPF